MERRRTPRVALLAELSGHLIVLDESVRVHEMSADGLTVETGCPLSPRTTHDLRLDLDHESMSVKARVVHSRVLMQGDRVSFLSGLALEGLTPDQRAALARFLESAGSPIARPRTA